MKRSIITCLFALFVSVCLANHSLNDSLEDSIWNNRYSEIIVPIRFLTEDSYHTIITKNSLDGRTADMIHILCYDCERRKYICNYKDYSLKERMKEKSIIDSIYQDSIYALLIPLNPDITSPLLFAAVDYSHYAVVDSSQYHSLKKFAIEIARRKYFNPCIYFAKEEMDTIKCIFNRKQVEAIINEKNKVEAKKRAENVWKRISLTNDFDSLDSIAQTTKAFSYYLKEMFIRDFYIGKRDLIDNNLKDLNMHRPQIIKMFDGLVQQDNIQKKYQKEVGVEFAW